MERFADTDSISFVLGKVSFSSLDMTLIVMEIWATGP